MRVTIEIEYSPERPPNATRTRYGRDYPDDEWNTRRHAIRFNFSHAVMDPETGAELLSRELATKLYRVLRSQRWPALDGLDGLKPGQDRPGSPGAHG